MPELRHIGIGLIDAPPLPMRATMDDAKLLELATSIREIGLQQPITVIEEFAAHAMLCPAWDHGECDCHGAGMPRYRIVTGHRRFIASQMIQAVEVLCIVRKPGEVQELAAMVAENVCREDVNPAEEAIWYHQLVTEHGYTEEQLMNLTKRSADYIGDRFRLLRGDEQVFAAVQRGDINYATGRELNKLPDKPMRRYYLDAAIRGGNNSRVVRKWVDDWKINQVPQSSEPVSAVAVAETPSAESYKLECAICGGFKDPWRITHVAVHRDEWDSLMEAVKRAGRDAS